MGQPSLCSLQTCCLRRPDGGSTIVVIGWGRWNHVGSVFEFNDMWDLGLDQLLIPHVLRLDTRYVWSPHVFEEDALFRREVERKISSSAPAYDTEIVVQSPPNNVVGWRVFRVADL